MVRLGRHRGADGQASEAQHNCLASTSAADSPDLAVGRRPQASAVGRFNPRLVLRGGLGSAPDTLALVLVRGDKFTRPSSAGQTVFSPAWLDGCYPAGGGVRRRAEPRPHPPGSGPRRWHNNGRIVAAIRSRKCQRETQAFCSPDHRRHVFERRLGTRIFSHPIVPRQQAATRRVPFAVRADAVRRVGF